MDHKTPVSEFMTTDLITAKADTTLRDIGHKMKENAVHHIPIVDDEGLLLGMISMSDIRSATLGARMMRNAQREDQTDALLASLLAEEVMQEKVVRLEPHDSLETAVGIFRENRFHALPICENKKVIGIITPLDIVNFAMRPE